MIPEHKHKHIWQLKVVAATCMYNGSRITVCMLCGKEKVVSVPKLTDCPFQDHYKNGVHV